MYLGNHGESQALDQLIRAAALAGPRVHLTLVGHGSQKPALQRLALQLRAPVDFLPPEYREAVFQRYQGADSLVISLRDDWKSFEATVPSKTYEALAVGRHITGVVRGEAARVLQDAGEGDVVSINAQSIAGLWCELAADRSRLQPRGTGRDWVREHAEYADLSREYDALLRATVRNHARARNAGAVGRVGHRARAMVQVMQLFLRGTS